MRAAAFGSSERKLPCATLDMRSQHSGILDQTELVSLTNPTISWAQLENGKLDVKYRVVQAGPLVVSSRTASLAIQIEGALEPNRTSIATIESLRSGARWCGHKVDSETVAVSRGVLDLRTAGLSTTSAIVVNERELQAQLPNSLDAADLLERLNCSGVSHSPDNAACFRQFVESVCFTREMPAQRIVGTLIPLLVATLTKTDPHSVERDDASSRRFRAVRTCEKYMREHLDTHLTLLDLSVVCGMRSRTLTNAFGAVTGFGPMEYLKRLRLSGVRRALQSANRSQIKVIDVAMEWGFWHMSHFARDYRIMFGESPSQTIPR